MCSPATNSRRFFLRCGDSSAALYGDSAIVLPAYVFNSGFGSKLSTCDVPPTMWNERLPDGRVRPRANPDVVKILSVSPNYAYGLDRRGRLLVIDAVRGSTLSSFDVSAFSVPVTNEMNDRVYLAANSGLLLCLHDRNRVRPELLRKPPAAKKVEPEFTP